jgi:phage replication O-like protein O
MMASPQLENGHTRIANELLEAIVRYHCSGAQKDIILAVIRVTYGFRTTSRAIGTAYLAKLTGRHPKKVAADVSVLIQRRVLKQVEGYAMNKARTLALNKNYDDWVSTKSLPVNETVDRVSTKPLTGCQRNRRPNKEIFKETSKETCDHPSPTKKKMEECAARIYEHYAIHVRAGARADALRSIAKLLKVYSEDVLIGCIDKYRGNGLSEEKQYRIQSNNFFGRAERFKEYLNREANLGRDSPQPTLTETQKILMGKV